MGSFVPAHKAVVGVADCLFARIGAADNVARHMSTFHVEMSETANILSMATKHSFVILDEIGIHMHCTCIIIHLTKELHNINIGNKPHIELCTFFM